MLYYKDLYWYFDKALSNSVCNKIIKAGQKNKPKLGRIGSFAHQDFKTLNKQQKTSLKKTRDSYVSFVDEKWLYDLLFPYVNEANELGRWKFIFDWAEPIQFTKYRKNQHYDWHNDSGGGENLRNIRSHGKIRKLSLVASLSDPKDYEGGDFQFQFRNSIDPTQEETAVQLKSKGSIIVFPSYIWHKVKPITKGTRYSIVMWTSGWPYV